MEKFLYDFTDDDGTKYEFLYWETNGRFFRQVRSTYKTMDGEVIETTDKPRRIGEAEYISAYETYKDY